MFKYKVYVYLLGIVKVEEFFLLKWFFYLEYVLLILVLFIGMMMMGCVCLKCCKVCGVIRDNDDDDDEKWNEDGFKKLKWDIIILLDIKYF